MSDAITNRQMHITVTHGMSGYFAVLVDWVTDDEEGDKDFGFWEPVTTGFGRYATKEEAVVEAQSWAEAEEIPFVN